MKYKFKVGDKVRLYRTDKWCLLRKGDVGIITHILEDYSVINILRRANGITWDCVQLAFLAHVKE